MQSGQEGGIGLGINVNVANVAFWLSQDFEQLVREYIRAYDRKYDQSKSHRHHSNINDLVCTDANQIDSRLLPDD